MAGITERLCDLSYKIAAEVVSWMPGYNARFEKEVITGPKVNGLVRPDLTDVHGEITFEAIRTGHSMNVQEFHVRQVRRKIVFYT